MVVSMTGFSSRTADITLAGGGVCSIAIEVKSLNSRFFEASCKLPSSLGHLEIDIINMLKARLIRGRVFITIRLTGEDALTESVSPSMGIIRGLINGAAQVQKTCGIDGSLTMRDILLFPSAFVIERRSLQDSDMQHILAKVKEAMDEVTHVRTKEGQRLKDDLEERFATARRLITKIKNVFEALIIAHKEKVDAALARVQAGDEQAKSQSDLLQIELSKMDISEEITRFMGHLTASDDLLRDAQIDKGRRFDFTLQELMREINTITAKSPSFEICSIAVDVKVELEKAREQVQNIV